ncbi:MAG: hypothetical protein WC058_05220 [Phycisphaeraceae bacterium]
MPNRSSISKKDMTQLAKAIVEASTAESRIELLTSEEGKNVAAVTLGRLGGLKGGKARAAKLSAKQRSEIAKRAANIRWSAHE